MSIKVNKGSPAWYGDQNNSQGYLASMYEAKFGPDITC